MRKYDFDPELEDILGSLKDHPALGGDFDFKKSWKQVSKSCGLPEDTSGMKHGFRDYLEFYLWDFSHQLLQPLATFAVFVLLFVGGSVGITNASMGTLPGDRLYPVKLGMEKAQLALATSDSQRASLRTEFTSRRLDEMVALAASAAPSDLSQLAMAVDRAKQDVTEISASLEESGKTSAQTTELAKAVGRKADAYANAVDASNPSLSKDVQKKVKEVKDILTKTKDQAVEVIITAHEQAVTDASTHDVQAEFAKEFAHAVTVASKEEAVKLKQASDLQKIGAYRRAFQVLKEIEIAHAPIIPTE